MQNSSNYVMVQIILAMIIIALAFYLFKFYPFEKGNVKKLVIAAIFVILTSICKRLAIMIPLFGLESLKIGFEYIPLMLAGYMLSPSYAFLIGLCSDLIGLILVPTGFPFLGFTLGTILVSVIPSLVKEHTNSLEAHQIETLAKCFIVIIGIGASLYIYQLESITISQTEYLLSFQHKLFFILICIALVLIFLSLIYFLKKKINDQEAKSFSIWMLCVILVELVVTLCLTPLWLEIMYGIPYIVSLCIRVIKECFVIPIEIFIGYTLIKILNKTLVK